jgi:hypothetical protein
MSVRAWLLLLVLFASAPRAVSADDSDAVVSDAEEEEQEPLDAALSAAAGAAASQPAPAPTAEAPLMLVTPENFAATVAEHEVLLVELCVRAATYAPRGASPGRARARSRAPRAPSPASPAPCSLSPRAARRTGAPLASC